MSEAALTFMVFWGVWILIPVAVDGIDSLYRMFLVRFFKRKRNGRRIEAEELPNVSVIIPAYNEEKIIDRCLTSLKIQDYPHDKLEVIVVDDGSTDGTGQTVKNHANGNGRNGNGNGKNGNGNGNGKNGNGDYYAYQNGNGIRINGKFIPVGDFSGVIKLLTKHHQGKANALNMGITHCHGEIIINIDSDVVLAPHAIRKMVEAFMKDPELGAATGNIEISVDILEERDEEGYLVLDEKGEIVQRKLNPMERWLANNQFLEYLNSFRLGREAQDITGSMYTLAGAFSAFRRDVVLKSSLYRAKTVSEDTDLTLDIQRQPVRVGFIAEAKAYLEPIVDWDKLYAQRVRWHRGQIEVCSLHQDMIGNNNFGNIGLFGLTKMLSIDHSMAFPRLIWTFLLPLFWMFGYSLKMINLAIIGMYVFYIILEFLGLLLIYNIVEEKETKDEIERLFGYCIFLPIYRFIVFYFRMSGYMVVLKEEPSWTVPGPVNGFKNGMNGVKKKAIEGYSMLTLPLWNWATALRATSAGAVAVSVPKETGTMRKSFEPDSAGYLFLQPSVNLAPGKPSLGLRLKLVFSKLRIAGVPRFHPAPTGAPSGLGTIRQKVTLWVTGTIVAFIILSSTIMATVPKVTQNIKQASVSAATTLANRAWEAAPGVAARIKKHLIFIFSLFSGGA